MAPPRKPVSRGTGEIDHDPERENKTQARAPNPVAEDPEVSNATQARAPNPLTTGAKKALRPPAGEDPERANKTQARAPRPTGPDDGDYRTASQYGPGEDEPGYRTGQSYQAADEALAGEVNLEGDGLDALDPELGSRTKALPAMEADAPAADEPPEEADDANATRAGPPIVLEIVAGPDAGKKKRFKGVRMVIGRTPGVDFLLSDQSVSRRHVELIHGDDGVLLRDLGSGNGTRLNGAKVAEKKLEHGDEIGIGKTKIRFVDEVAAFQKLRDAAEKKEPPRRTSGEKPAAAPSATLATEGEPEDPASTRAAEGDGEGGSDEGGEAEPAEAPAERKAPSRRAATAEGQAPRERVRPVRGARQAEGGDGGFAARFKAMPRAVRLGVVGLVTVILLMFVARIVLTPPPPPPVDPAKVLADQKMQEARNAAREGDFERVVALVEEAEKLLPGIDKTKLASQAREELAVVRALDEAQGHIDARRFEDARKALGGAGKGSNKIEERKGKLREALEVAEVAYQKEKIEEFIAAGELEAARALLGELPVEQQAEPAAKIVEAERELEAQRALDAKDAARAAANAAAAKKLAREQEMNEAFVVVERKFAGSEWERAASECNRVMDAYRSDADISGRAKKLQSLIPSFGRNYDEGMKKFRQGAIAQAAKPLRAAHQLFGQMGLRANKFGPEIEERLGASAIAAGKEALVRNDLVTAWQMFKDAARFDPGDAKARAGLDEVQARAEELFQTAYVARDRDPREAVRKFKIVVQVTDPGTSVHEKAKNQLAAMAP